MAPVDYTPPRPLPGGVAVDDELVAHGMPTITTVCRGETSASSRSWCHHEYLVPLGYPDILCLTASLDARPARGGQPRG